MAKRFLGALKSPTTNAEDTVQVSLGSQYLGDISDVGTSSLRLSGTDQITKCVPQHLFRTIRIVLDDEGKPLVHAALCSSLV